MKNIFILSVFTVLIFAKVNAQDIHFSQFYEAPQIVNPALTGYFIGEHRFIVNYKDQWRAIGSPYKTAAFSYDAGFNKRTNETGYLALGVMLFNDQAGDLNLSTTQALFNVGYHLKISRNQTFGAGLQAGFGQKSIDHAKMQWDNQYDVNLGGFNPNLAHNESKTFNTVTYPDFGFGVLYTVKGAETNIASNDGFRANIGASLFHVNNPRLEFFDSNDSAKLSQRLSVHGQALIGISGTKMAFAPSFFYYNQNKMQEVYLGGAFRYMLREHARYTGFVNDAYFSLGGYYRLQDAAILFAQFELNDFAFGLSYDFNISRLRMATDGRGGVEIALRYTIAETTQKSIY